MQPTDFVIKFDTESHDIEVGTLIGSLMHTSALIQEINRELDANKKIEVKIKALAQGSFEIHIELIEKLLNSLFSSDNVAYTSGLVAVLGGAYKLASFLKGKKPTEVKESDAEKTQVTNANGDVVIFQNSIVNIYNTNKNVRDGIAKQFAELKENKDISGFKFSSGGSEIVSIPKNEFRDVAQKIAPGHIEETEVEVEENQKLQIIRPSFEEIYNWDFFYKGVKIAAKVTDESIVAKINNGEQFAKGDYMLADIQITKFYNEEYDTYLIQKDSYKVVKFREHVKGHSQSKLF